jgi:hypothetical protein
VHLERIKTAVQNITNFRLKQVRSAKTGEIVSKSNNTKMNNTEPGEQEELKIGPADWE